MPLPKHTVQPVRVSQVTIPNNAENELEFVANATLCNLMRQMASISLLAANMLRELTSELSILAERTMRLQNRLVLLQNDVQSMQKTDEDLTTNAPLVQLAPFVSKKPADSRLLSRNTLPPSMRACFERADPPPALHQLDLLRDDKKVSMKLYSDPDFFFDFWSRKMLQDPRRKGSGKKRRVKPKQKISTSKQLQTKTPMIIQQTGVGGYPVPQPHGIPEYSPMKKGAPIEQQSTDFPLPPTSDGYSFPPQPPTTMVQSTQSAISKREFAMDSSYQGDHLTIQPEFPNFNGLPHPVGRVQPSLQPMNGVSSSIQHPPPPPLPSTNDFASDLTDYKTVNSPNASHNSVHSLEGVAFPMPSPTVVRNMRTNSSARPSPGSPASSSLISHELPPPPAPIFDNLDDGTEIGVTQSQFLQNHIPTPPPLTTLPPPPPPPLIPVSPCPTSTANVGSVTKQMENLTVTDGTGNTSGGPPQDLLSAIRAGFQLRKVAVQPISTAASFSQISSAASLSNKPTDVQTIYEAVRRRRDLIDVDSSEGDNADNSSSSGWSD